MRSAIVLFVALAAVAELVFGDDYCVSEDKQVEQVLFKQLKNQLQSTDSESITLPDFHKEFMGFGVEWKGAKAGDFSSLSLTTVPAPSASSQLCKSINGDIFQRRLTINVGFDSLKASFREFSVITPFFNIGGQNNAIALSDENLLVTVDTQTSERNNICTAHLPEFKFTSWGNLEISLGDSGIINLLLEKVFNSYANTKVLNLLEKLGVASMVNDAVTAYASQIIDAAGQQQTVCQLVNQLE